MPNPALRLPPLERATTPARIADSVRGALLRGEIVPGTPLREADLSQRLEVSRHTVREAFRLLAAEGLVSHHAFRGVVVRELLAEDVADIYGVRRLIEVQGVEAARRIPEATLTSLEASVRRFDRAVQSGQWDRAFEQDFEFHVALVALGGSRRLVDLARVILRELRLAHFVVNDLDTAAFRKSRAQHREILRHLRAGDRASARQAVLDHLEQSEVPLRRALALRQGTPER